jgi:hypothetical protein
MELESDRYFKERMRGAIRMSRGCGDNRRLRTLWQQRVADYRELLIDRMRRRQGWSLAARVAAWR